MIKCSMLAALFCWGFLQAASYDLTIVGTVQFKDGLGRLSISLTDMLKKDLKINHIMFEKPDFADVPAHLHPIIQNPDKQPGSVSLLTQILWQNPRSVPARFVPNSPIKIAYSMIESTAIPKAWVTILNSRFDAVAVPDEFLVKVYQKSGVRIPVFVLEHTMYLDDYLKVPLKSGPGHIFTFGASATLIPRKNYELILDAFYKEFGNKSAVQLKLHARGGNRVYAQQIRNKIRRMGLRNVKLIEKRLSALEYKEFLTSLDCYVYLSKGEGFSLTPREAMACGIPCIVSDNTAQKTICKTGLVRAVPSNKRELAYYPVFGGTLGYNFNCELKDACNALRDMYTNYHKYLQKTAQARKWVKQYQHKNLRPYYVSMIKPARVYFGATNKVDKHSLTTNSRQLVRKYRALKASS